MSKIAALSAIQLQKALDKHDGISSAICQELIAAGFGTYRHSDIAEQRDSIPLFEKYMAAFEARQEYARERDRRVTYHGTLKPIKVTQF